MGSHKFFWAFLVKIVSFFKFVGFFNQVFFLFFHSEEKFNQTTYICRWTVLNKLAQNLKLMDVKWLSRILLEIWFVLLRKVQSTIFFHRSETYPNSAMRQLESKHCKLFSAVFSGLFRLCNFHFCSPYPFPKVLGHYTR